jgi:peptidoglycan/xylan/chitin deacetylase (PgdA/CDA1 family)
MRPARQKAKTFRSRKWKTAVWVAAVLILIGVAGGACTPPPGRLSREKTGSHASGHGLVRAGLGTEQDDSIGGAVRRAGVGARRGPAFDAGRVAVNLEPLRVQGRGPVSGFTQAFALYSQEAARLEATRLAAARRWGLDRAPLIAPPPPAVKPRLTTPRQFYRGPGLPAVIARVPTEQRVVFLTIDDGVEKDPALIRMVRDLQIPFSAFLTDAVIRNDYDYFRRLQRDGAAMNNHTINHLDMRRLPYERQRREICAQQRTLKREFGIRPRIFRPPYGSYNQDTLRAARACGISVVPLWTQEAFPGGMNYADLSGKLRPGDIILTHFRGRAQWNGTMADVVRRVVRTATQQGFALARLEDYV